MMSLRLALTIYCNIRICRLGVLIAMGLNSSNLSLRLLLLLKQEMCWQQVTQQIMVAGYPLRLLEQTGWGSKFSLI
ncbi:Rep [Chicken proventriculitis-associated circular virus 18]|nr:Rep [Chicken proventriculitis-associated circular virus 18]